MSQIIYEVLLLNIVVLTLLIGSSFHGFIYEDELLKGFREKYSAFMRSDEKKNLMIGITAFFIAQVLALLIANYIIGQFTFKAYFTNVGFGSIILGVAFDLFQLKNKNMKAKEIAIATKSDIIVDLDFKTLKLIFSLPLEIPVSIATILYIAISKDDQSLFYMFIFVQWFFYLTLKRSKYLIKSRFHENYSGMGKAIFWYHFLILFMFAGSELDKLDVGKQLSYPVIFVLICFLMILKAIYYARNYGTFKEKVAKTSPNLANRL